MWPDNQPARTGHPGVVHSTARPRTHTQQQAPPSQAPYSSTIQQQQQYGSLPGRAEPVTTPNPQIQHSNASNPVRPPWATMEELLTPPRPATSAGHLQTPASTSNQSFQQAGDPFFDPASGITPGSRPGSGSRQAHPQGPLMGHPAAPWVSRAIADSGGGAAGHGASVSMGGNGVSMEQAPATVLLLPGGTLEGPVSRAALPGPTRPLSAQRSRHQNPTNPSQAALAVQQQQQQQQQRPSPTGVKPKAAAGSVPAAANRPSPNARGAAISTPGAVPDAHTRSTSVPRNAAVGSARRRLQSHDSDTPSRSGVVRHHQQADYQTPPAPLQSQLSHGRGLSARRASPASLLDGVSDQANSAARRPSLLPRSQSHTPSWSPPPWNAVPAPSPASAGRLATPDPDVWATPDTLDIQGPVTAGAAAESAVWGLEGRDNEFSPGYGYGAPVRGGAGADGHDGARLPGHGSLEASLMQAARPGACGQAVVGGVDVEGVAGSVRRALPAGALGSGASAAATGAARANSGTFHTAANRARQAAVEEEERLALAQEARDLRQEVAYLKQLLGVTTAAEAVAGTMPDQQVPAALTRARSQCWQLQRQVALMGAEIKAHSQLTALAEGCLLEVKTKLGEFLAAPGAAAPELSQGQLAATRQWALNMRQRMNSERAQLSRQLSRPGIQQQQQATPAHTARGGHSYANTGADAVDPTAGAPSWQLPWMPVGGNRHLAASMAAAAATRRGGAVAASWSAPPRQRDGRAAGATGAAAGPTAAPAAEDVEAEVEAAAQVAAHCTLARIAQGIAAGTLFESVPADAGQAANTGTNSSSPPARGTATLAGQPSRPLLALLTAEPAAAQQLDTQLVRLAPQLASLAVLLRTSLLPALPWLATEAADRLQAEVAETSQAVATASKHLSAITDLLPGGPVVLSQAQVATDLQARGAQVSAGRDAWMYADGPQPELHTDPLIAYSSTCGLDVSALLGSVIPLLKDRKTGTRQIKQLIDKLLVVPLQAGQNRHALLEQELGFCCRITALQAQHVSHMIQTVKQEVARMRACTGTSEGNGGGLHAAAHASSPDGGRPSLTARAHAQSLTQLCLALEDLDRHPNEAGLARVVEELQAGRPALVSGAEALLAAAHTGPQAHEGSPAAGQGGDLARLEQALQALHPALHTAMGRVTARKQQARAEWQTRQQPAPRTPDPTATNHRSPSLAQPSEHQPGTGEAVVGHIAMPWDYESPGPAAAAGAYAQEGRAEGRGVERDTGASARSGMRGGKPSQAPVQRTDWVD